MINLGKILHLTRPLTVFDLETTGSNPDLDQIWQIAITKHYPDQEPVSWWTYIKPKIQIPRELIEGFTDAEGNRKLTPEVLALIDKAPPFSHYAGELAQRVLRNTDYAGFYILFDLRAIRREFNRVEINWDWEKSDSRVICSQRIYQVLFPRDLQSAYKTFVNKHGFLGSHDAANDVRATEEVLFGQLEKFAIPRTIPELSDYCYPRDKNWIDRQGRIIWRNGEASIGFGKHQGIWLKDMVREKSRREYLEWIVRSAFPEDTKVIIRDALTGIFPTR